MSKFVLAFVLLLGACGSDSSGGPDAADIGCTNDPRAMMYLPNMQVTGAGNLLKFQLVSSDPAPPIKGNNTFTLKILDASNNPVTGATLMVMPYMPDHGHGTSVVPQITPNGDSYTVTPLYLFMAGLWEIRLQATSSAGNDGAVFKFCIQG